MRLRYFRYQDSWRIQRSFQTFPTFYFTPFNQCFTSGICVGFAMFYYILIFFYCVLPIYLLFFRSAWELICFRSIPRWIALGAALESPLSGPAKRVAAFLGDGGEGLPGKKRWGRSNPRWKFPPYFVWYFFFASLLLLESPDGFLGTHFDGRFICESMASMISGFSQEHLKGVGSHTTSALAESCVALYLSWWWFDHLGGSFQDLRARMLHWDLQNHCVWLFVYLCCQVLNTIHLPW